MAIDDEVLAAVRSAKPGWALRSLAQGLLAQGYDKKRLCEDLERIVSRARVTGEFGESGEDAVFDLLDALTGWCHPSAQLPPPGPTTPVSPSTGASSFEPPVPKVS
jgi:hypothetical protein